MKRSNEVMNEMGENVPLPERRRCPGVLQQSTSLFAYGACNCLLVTLTVKEVEKVWDEKSEARKSFREYDRSLFVALD